MILIEYKWLKAEKKQKTNLFFLAQGIPLWSLVHVKLFIVRAIGDKSWDGRNFLKTFFISYWQCLELKLCVNTLEFTIVKHATCNNTIYLHLRLKMSWIEKNKIPKRTAFTSENWIKDKISSDLTFYLYTLCAVPVVGSIKYFSNFPSAFFILNSIHFFHTRFGMLVLTQNHTNAFLITFPPLFAVHFGPQ